MTEPGIIIDAPPSTDCVHQAVLALHHDSDPANKGNANKWLTKLQESVFAWKVADDLLHEKRDMLSCYFGAQTIRNKIQSSFHELPVDSHDSLRASLVDHIRHITAETDDVITTQLCVAMADLGLQMLTWENPALDLIQNLIGNPPNAGSPHVCALFEVLRVLPEELSSRHFRLGQSRRDALKKAFLDSFTVVISILNECVRPDRLEAEDARFPNGGRYATAAPSQRAVRCLTSWLEVPDIPTEDMIFEPILRYACEMLIVDNVPGMAHERAVECVSAAIYVCDGITPSPCATLRLANWMQTAVYSMVNSFHFCVAQEDIDKVMGYARVFVDLVDSLMRCIVIEPNVGLGSFNSLELLLLCAGHHDYEIAGVTFNVWYRLSEELFQRRDTGSVGLLRPYVTRLVLALCRHCQMEPDHDGLADEGSDFEEFRGRVLELVRDVMYIVGTDECFNQMHSLLSPLLEDMNRRNGATINGGGDGSGSSSSGNAGWEGAEACLFIMSAVAKHVSSHPSDVVEHTVSLILNLPSWTHVAMKYTAIQVLGELAHWHEANTRFSDEVMRFLLLALSDKTLAPAAATALEQICMQCRNFMGIPHVEVLFLALKTIDDDRQIPRQSAVGVLVSMVSISSRLEPDESRGIMQELFRYHVNYLNSNCHGEHGGYDVGTPGSKKNRSGSSEEPVMWLDRIAVIGRHMNPTLPLGAVHPCRDVVVEMWPVIDNVFNKYADDARVMERACRCLRFLVRSVSKQCADLLQPLVPKLVEMYGRKRHGCFLYLGSVLVDEFGMESNYHGGLVSMLEAFLPHAFDLLKDPDSRRNHPDTIDDLFRLCTRFLQRMPRPFLLSHSMKGILEVGLAAVLLDHKDANVAIMKFWLDFIQLALKYAKDDDEIEDYQHQAVLARKYLVDEGCGACLIKNIAFDVVGLDNFSMSHYLIPDFADVFYSLLLLDREQMCLWVEAALRALHDQVPPGAAAAVSQQQLVGIHKLLTSAENSRLVCRGLKDLNQLYQ